MSVSVNIPKTVSGEPTRGETQRQEWQRQVAAAAGQPALSCTIAVGNENTPSANDRDITIQVVNRKLERCFGIYPLLVVMSTDEIGGPSGTQTTSWQAGAQVAELAVGQAWIVLTDPNGSAVLRANIAGVAERYVKAGWDGAMVIKGPIEWAP